VGHGKISYFLKENFKGCELIERDIKTLPESHDFIKDPDPEQPFDLVITNPPFSIKKEILDKVLSYPNDIKVVLLLPMDILSGVTIGVLLKKKSFHVDLLFPHPKFLCQGKEIDTASCGWFYFNFETIKSTCTFSIIQNGVIPDLDEESEDEVSAKSTPKKKCFLSKLFNK